jgi:hypothetical protein
MFFETFFKAIKIANALATLVLYSVGFTGGGLLRVYSCSDVVANRCRF